MKAIIWTEYGPADVLKLQEIPTPTPKRGEIFVKVHAAAVSAGDCEMRSLQFPLYYKVAMRLFTGWRRPTRITILGQDYAGEVAAVGPEVTQFQKGDHIFGNTGFHFGTFAEYLCLPESEVIAKLPLEMGYAEGAGLPLGGLNALHFLRKARIQPSQEVLINGAGGSIGSVAVQLAKYYGAHVTAIDHGDKLPLLTSLGADQVFDYTLHDFTAGASKFDVIFDIACTKPLREAMRPLKSRGVYLMGNPTLGKGILAIFWRLFSHKKVVGGAADYHVADLESLRDLCAQGVVKVPIDRRFSLEETAEAHRYVETGQKRGNVVIVLP